MNFISGPELISSLHVTPSADLFVECFKIHNLIHCTTYLKKLNFEQNCLEYAAEQLNYNTDTTLVLHSLSEVSDELQICVFIKDMDKENFINLLNKTIKMKSFL